MKILLPRKGLKFRIVEMILKYQTWLDFAGIKSKKRSRFHRMGLLIDIVLIMLIKK